MRRELLVAALAAFGALAFTAPAMAQHARTGPPRPPESAFQFRFGWLMPSGDSDFWDVSQEAFDLRVSDFDDFVVGFSYVHGLSNTVDIGVSLDFYRESARSAYRDYLDEDDLRILHDTRLSMVPWTVDVRFIPGGRYRIRPGGRYIRKTLFYLGGGAGVNFWDYEEVGDFLDFGFIPPDIFRGRFVDDGTALVVYALAGAEVPVGRSTNLTFEARYSVSEDKLRGDFAGLPETDLDLGSVSVSVGFAFRF